MFGYGAHEKIRHMIAEVCSKNFILLDFNYRCIDWASNYCDSDASAEEGLFSNL